MTNKQAQFLLKDWGNNLLPDDYCETVYLSIKGVGAKTFKNCCYHDSGNYIFIWTSGENLAINKKNLGDFVSVPTDASKRILVSVKKELNLK